MDYPEQHPITDEEARRLAKGLVLLLRSPLKLIGTHSIEEPVTIADAIRIGGTILAALNVANGRDWVKERNREFLLQLAELSYLPDAMEEFLYKRIKDRSETAEGITEAITKVEGLMVGPGAVRKFLKMALLDVLPKPARGRPTEFKSAGDPERFLSLSAQMSGICRQFLALREQFPRKSIKELLVFLQSENPKGIELLRKHGSYITQTMNGFDFRILKTQAAKVRRLSDAVAGKELFRWAFTYAVQRGGEFRRAKGIEPEE
jgi:hypothetical protein